MLITKSVRLDLTPGAIPPRVKVSQYDDESREIVFTLVASSGSGSVSDADHAYVCGTKPDGHGFQYDATINNNGTVSVLVVQQMTACSGAVDCEIKLTKTENSHEIVLNSANFILDVEKAALGEDTIVSDTEIPAIIDAAETNAERAEAAAARAVDAAAHGPYIGANGHWYVWNNSEGVYVDTQVVAEGEDGVGISSIAKTGTSGLVDTYTITLTNGQTTTFTVTNGEDGTDGVDGVSITNIDKTGTAGRVDTYTIYFSNGRTEYFTVTNGTDALPTGGTAGQVLVKSSSTFYDADWGDVDIPVATTSTAGKVKPDGTTITIGVDGTISASGSDTKVELAELKNKTWTGLTSFYGSAVWTDGTDIYYSSGSTQKVLNKATGTWSNKSWSGISSFSGSQIWTDGTNIYYSNSSTQKVLNTSTSTWSDKTWTGMSSFNGVFIWTDGTDIYYSDGSATTMVLDTSDSSWSNKSFTGITYIVGNSVWTDGANVYYSETTEQKVLDVATSAWSDKTWTGITSFSGSRIWTDGTDIFYSNGSSQKVLNKANSTWSDKSWAGLSSFDGTNVWTDGQAYYLSNDSTQKFFDYDHVEPTATTDILGLVKPDGSTITIAEDGTISSVGGGDEGELLTGTLLAASWNNKSQTVSVTGLNSSDIGVVGVLDTATSAQLAAAEGVTPVSVSNGIITFTCEDVPAVDIPFGIVVTGTSSNGNLPDGGTTGQVLKKKSNTDLDVEWGTIPDTTKMYSTDDTAFTDIADGDYIPVYDTSATTKKKSLWSNIKSLLKTYFDTLYQKKLAYSTSEQVIGTWITGKPLYQKTINFGSLPNNSSKSVALNIANLNNITKIEAIAYGGSGSSRYWWSIPYAATGAITDQVMMYLDPTNININTKKDMSSSSAYITVQYTKTTD